MIIPTFVPDRPPSPRVQELGQKIALAIAEYQQNNPDVSAEEVRQAARLATSQVDASGGRNPRAVAAAVVAIAALGLGVWLQSASAGSRPPAVGIIAVAVAVIAVVAVVMRRRD